MYGGSGAATSDVKPHLFAAVLNGPMIGGEDALDRESAIIA